MDWNHRITNIHRRTFLVAGGVGFCGMHLPSLVPAAEPTRRKPAKSCILLWLSGGASHIDTWDMKPDAVAEYRGPFRPQATSAPGLLLCEHLPHLARQAHHLAVVRSLGDHGDGAPFAAALNLQPGADGRGSRPHRRQPDGLVEPEGVGAARDLAYRAAVGPDFAAVAGDGAVQRADPNQFPFRPVLLDALEGLAADEPAGFVPEGGPVEGRAAADPENATSSVSTQEVGSREEEGWAQPR